MKGVVFHYGLFKIIWDWFVLLLVLYTAVEVPFVVAFVFDDEFAADSSGELHSFLTFGEFIQPCMITLLLHV